MRERDREGGREEGKGGGENEKEREEGGKEEEGMLALQGGRGEEGGWEREGRRGRIWGGRRGRRDDQGREGSPFCGTLSIAMWAVVPWAWWREDSRSRRSSASPTLLGDITSLAASTVLVPNP